MTLFGSEETLVSHLLICLGIDESSIIAYVARLFSTQYRMFLDSDVY